MDTPSSVHDTDTNVIVQSLVDFLNPRDAHAFSLTSQTHHSAVSSTGSLGYIARRQVQRIIGRETITPSCDHDWDLTHTLLVTDPGALYCTGSPVDADIAKSVGALDSSLDADQSRATWEAGDAITAGHLAAFKLREKSERHRLSAEDYIYFISAALMSNRLDILSLPEMVKWIGMLDASDMDNALEIIVDYKTSPSVVDFFLSHAPPAGIDFNRFIHRIIEDGSYGLVKVALKHDLVPFGGLIDGKTYSSEDDCYDKMWGPLWLAAKNDRVNIVLLLLSHPRAKEITEMNDDGALHTSVRRGCVEVVRLLLDSGLAELDEVYLPTVAEKGRLEMVELLLSYPAAKINNYCVRRAVENEHTEVALLLLRDPTRLPSDLNKKSLLSSALSAGDETVIAAVRAL